jgi:hypothetical protein
MKCTLMSSQPHAGLAIYIFHSSVLLLVSLKRTLTRLSLTSNPDINNEAVPTLVLLSNLLFLSILDTGLDMVGLRRLAEFMHETNQLVDVEMIQRLSICEFR